MEKARRVMRVGVAALSVIVCLSLCVQAIDIYLKGNAPANFSAPGVRINPVYSREIIAQRFMQLMPLILLYFITLVIAAFMRAWVTPKARPSRGEKPPARQEMRGRAVLRMVLFVCAGVLIVAGIANGGMRDVLIKAINICTECIGLG